MTILATKKTDEGGNFASFLNKIHLGDCIFIMKKLFIISSLIFAILSGLAQAITFTKKPYIDATQLKNDQLLDKRQEEACGEYGEYDVLAKMDCYDNVLKQWYSEGRDRGTSEYCDVHLVPASTAELKAMLPELNKLYKISRKMPPDLKSGEIASGDFKRELNCIQEILRERNE